MDENCDKLNFHYVMYKISSTDPGVGRFCVRTPLLWGLMQFSKI